MATQANVDIINNLIRSDKTNALLIGGGSVGALLLGWHMNKWWIAILGAIGLVIAWHYWTAYNTALANRDAPK